MTQSCVKIDFKLFSRMEFYIHQAVEEMNVANFLSVKKVMFSLHTERQLCYAQIILTVFA